MTQLLGCDRLPPILVPNSFFPLLDPASRMRSPATFSVCPNSPPRDNNYFSLYPIHNRLQACFFSDSPTSSRNAYPCWITAIQTNRTADIFLI
ncbi:MAG: hypothetical protein H0X31_00020 [Nostocaceae cyanobacterium]|nr:hypothetical protein [Nostocaceae cyanobacterium]